MNVNKKGADIWFMRKNKLRYLIGFIVVIIISFFIMYNHYKKPEIVTPSDGNRYNRGHNIPGKLYWAGSDQDKMVALTFDDGPEEYWTPKILDILKEKNVKATFFVIGQQAKKYPEMLRRINSEGHVIGDHTFDHVDLRKLDAQEADKEIEKCAILIHEIIGKTPSLVRPPFGFHNATVDNVIYSKNEIIILWSLDTEDWTGLDAETVKARVLPKMQNGFIVLQHDGDNPKLGGSVQALPDIIDGLKAQGYIFVTVAELLNIQPYQ
ncbi:MAG: polysaccharide deacetylase [Firmicutes bacterium]|nr:polysaccharide deacetylase [Bacillota bacterium]